MNITTLGCFGCSSMTHICELSLSSLKNRICSLFPRMEDLYYMDRKTGQKCKEQVYGGKALSLLYGQSPVARCISAICLPILTNNSFCSRLYGAYQNCSWTRKNISSFIDSFQIDPSEFLQPVHAFSSFNDFFMRKLKPECRPIDEDPTHAILPADARYLVIPELNQVDGFYVKGQQFSLETFLQDPELVKRYSNGAMVIARLCPTDYHRFHFPVSGVVSETRPIDGKLLSVNPIALSQRLSIFSENKRVLTTIDSEQFGPVLMAEVGATFVGSIYQTAQAHQVAKKGDEKGVFSFGGSCVILIFEKDRIKFAEDLIQNSAQLIETKGVFGTTLGTVVQKT